MPTPALRRRPARTPQGRRHTEERRKKKGRVPMWLPSFEQDERHFAFLTQERGQPERMDVRAGTLPSSPTHVPWRRDDPGQLTCPHGSPNAEPAQSPAVRTRAGPLAQLNRPRSISQRTGPRPREAGRYRCVLRRGRTSEASPSVRETGTKGPRASGSVYITRPEQIRPQRWVADRRPRDQGRRGNGGGRSTARVSRGPRGLGLGLGQSLGLRMRTTLNRSLLNIYKM